MWTCTLVLWCVASCAHAYVTYDQLAGKPYSIGSSERGFSIDGTPTLLLGGSMHPPRMARADWAPLLRQARADGLNHVQIYVFWNFHEIERGHLDFSPGTRRDLGGFFNEAAKAGLFVNVRIGPYVCAEWDGGGLPLWLADVVNFSCSRCADPVWQEHMGGFVRAVAAVMRPFLARVGGPIIMAQIENELQLSPSDPYVAWCGELAASLDLDIPWVMCNGASANNTINACNGRHCSDPGQYADTHAALFPGQPLMWTEDWSFFATWGNAVSDESGPAWASRIGNWFALGAAHHNYYMFVRRPVAALPSRELQLPCTNVQTLLLVNYFCHAFSGTMGAITSRTGGGRRSPTDTATAAHCTATLCPTSQSTRISPPCTER